MGDVDETLPGESGHVGSCHRCQADVARLGDKHGADAHREILESALACGEVGELVAEPGPGGHVEEKVGQLHQREGARQTAPERDEAGGLGHPVEGMEMCPMAAGMLVDGQRPVRRCVLGGPPPRQVQLGRQRGQLHVGFGLVVQHRAHLRAGLLPCGSLEELGAGVAPPAAGGDEHVSSAEAVAEAFHHAERVSLMVEAVRCDEATPSRGHNVVGRVVPGRLRALGVMATQEVDGVEHGAGRVDPVEVHQTQQQRQEPPDRRVAADQFLHSPLVGLLGQLRDHSGRSGHRSALESGDDAAQVDGRVAGGGEELHPGVA